MNPKVQRDGERERERWACMCDTTHAFNPYISLWHVVKKCEQWDYESSAFVNTSHGLPIVYNPNQEENDHGSEGIMQG